MTVRNLEFLFRPQSVAVVAALDARKHYAEVVLRNLAAGGFSGPVVPVTVKKHSVLGIAAHVHIDELEVAPELAVICAALGEVPQIISQLGARGTRAVIVGPSLRTRMNSRQVLEVRQSILDAARPWLMRVLGPGSGGVVVPGSGLNASIAPVVATPGKIALITQSAAIAAAVLDRAGSKGIGFSSVLHLGTGIDIDLADALDWLAADPDTEAILVQFETVSGGRKFRSAARAAARNKPVVAIRSGGGSEGQRAASRPFTTDDVYDAALRRAGWIRIETLDDMFDAAEAMARVRPMAGDRLTIVANGRGLGQIAADALLQSGGRLAPLSHDTAHKLGALLHTGAPAGNPVALPADVTPAQWGAALATLLADPATDALLTVCSPSPFAASAEVATAICQVAQHAERNVFTCWVGGSEMLEAQRIAAAHGVLSHDSPEKAIAIFGGVVNYERNRHLLLQMPPSVAEDFSTDLVRAREIVAAAMELGVDTLPTHLAYALLQAYGIDAADHPPTAGSVALRLGVADDPVFGPVIFLGPASTGTHADAAVVALPPLNRALAQDLVARSRCVDAASEVQRVALESALVRLSQLLTDLDQVTGIELDPLLADAAGVRVCAARIRIEKRGRRLGLRRFAIRPYPRELEQVLEWQGHRLLIRPIRPEDETTLADLIASLDPEDARMRFFGTMRKLPRSQLARFTQIDYDREMALVAIERDEDGIERSLGEVRVVADPDNAVADFAIVVRSDMKGKGLGRLLLQSIVDYCRSRGTARLCGETLGANLRMQHLARELGFVLKTGSDMGTVALCLQLRDGDKK
ncbi:MAG: GNAT family N-acetyltransferase [Sulfuritalea sp.]|nr:GNAT family N-acetyltransferase [Sulfuritalea sp.]